MNSTTEILALIGVFSQLFSPTVWEHAQTLLMGAILATGKRTVTSALNVVGKAKEKHFTNYHRVLNRTSWSMLMASKILLGLIVLLVPTGSVIIGADDTIERRRGRKIKAKGVYRDAVKSSRKHVIKCFGLKWVSMMVLVNLPVVNRVWALPFLTVLCWPDNKNPKSGKPHKSSIDIVGILIRLVVRWLPNRMVVLVVDGAFSAVKLALICSGSNVAMVSRLRMDAALYDEPGDQPKSKRGKKPLKGRRQPSLAELANRDNAPWEEREVAWYGGERKLVKLLSGAALWYTSGQRPVKLRYVVVRDPNGKLKDQAFFCTNIEVAPVQIVEWFVMRWAVEVTFEESRDHLGVETQRQWSDKAIDRTTPVLFGLFSIVTLATLRIAERENIPVADTAWYNKQLPTFSDCLAAVRLGIWRSLYFTNSANQPDLVKLQPPDLNHLLDCLAHAA